LYKIPAPADKTGEVSSVADTAQLVVRFKRLMREIESGALVRTSFYPWEVELLVDLDQCVLRANRRRLLRRYQKAAVHGLEMGGQRPLKLSEYLARTRSRRPRASAA
jgi:hypothetical protein